MINFIQWGGFGGGNFGLGSRAPDEEVERSDNSGEKEKAGDRAGDDRAKLGAEENGAAEFLREGEFFFVDVDEVFGLFLFADLGGVVRIGWSRARR